MKHGDKPKHFFRPRTGETSSETAERVRTTVESQLPDQSPDLVSVRHFDPSADDFDIDDWRSSDGRDLWRVGAEWGFVEAFIVRNILVVKDDCNERYREELDLPIDFVAQAAASFAQDEVGVSGPYLEIASDLLTVDLIRKHFDPNFNEEVLFNDVVVARDGQWL